MHAEITKLAPHDDRGLTLMPGDVDEIKDHLKQITATQSEALVKIQELSSKDTLLEALYARQEEDIAELKEENKAVKENVREIERVQNRAAWVPWIVSIVVGAIAASLAQIKIS